MKLIGFSVYIMLQLPQLLHLRKILSPKIIKKATEQTVSGVPNRFEQIDCGQEFTVVVDYAHTPDGLENIFKDY